MTSASAASPQAASTPPKLMPRIGLAAAFIILLAIVFMPPIAGLPQAGQMMLGILAVAVIVWMT